MSNFIPVSEFVEPDKHQRPYKLTVFRNDGSTETIEVNHGISLVANVLAVKVEIQSAAQRYMSQFLEKTSLYGHHRTGAQRMLNWLDEQGLLLDNTAKPDVGDEDWLDVELDLIRCRYNVPRTFREDIRRWLADPDKFPELPFDIGNSILTVKVVPGGRVVCLPTGHTVAYTYARALYRILCGTDPYDYHVNQNFIEVREYYGNKRWSSTKRKAWSMKNGELKIGCQTIPASAIESLARREGWDGKILNKYL